MPTRTCVHTHTPTTHTRTQHTHTHTHVYIHMCEYVCVCVFGFVYVYIIMHVFMYIYVTVYIHTYWGSSTRHVCFLMTHLFFAMRRLYLWRSLDETLVPIQRDTHNFSMSLWYVFYEPLEFFHETLLIIKTHVLLSSLDEARAKHIIMCTHWAAILSIAIAMLYARIEQPWWDICTLCLLAGPV